MHDMINYKDLGLVNTRGMFAKALKGGYAVPACNFSHAEQLQAIIQAAVETKSPVILQVSDGSRKYIGRTLLRFMAEGAVDYAKELGCQDPQIALHLAHGVTFELCKSCIDMGFSSIMIDASHLAYEANVALTGQVAEYAHQFDVTVEGNPGIRMYGIESDIFYKHRQFPNPEEITDFLTKTGCDSVVIHKRSRNSFNKFTDFDENGRLIPPLLSLNELEAIERQLPGLPFALYGTSKYPPEEAETANTNGCALKKAVGISEDILRSVAGSAVCKMDIDIDSRLAMTAAIRKILIENPTEFDPRKYLGPARDNARKLYVHKIRHVFGSDNKI